MKLVEILAEKLTKWPVGATYALQNKSIGSCEYKKVYFYGGVNEEHDFYCDILTVDCDDVTRAQWEAERARIYRETPLPNLDADAEAIIDDRCESTKKSRSKEDQALWDKVAIASIPALIANPSEWSGDDEAGGDIRSYEDAAKAAAFMADAFMAERAKRLDNSHTTISTT